jgi:adenylate cyclase class IV
VTAAPGVNRELELKAVVPDAALLRRRLLESGAVEAFRGLMEDRIFDRGESLQDRDEVLRVRTWRPDGGPPRAQMAWKGPTRRSPEGYKLRDELEFGVEGDGSAAAGLLRALGYEVYRSVDRFVEVYRVREAEVRVEWYPRMDILVEVEGTPAAIESAVGLTGLPPSAFEPEPLVEFVRRFEERTGEAAALGVSELKGERPQWERR